ncbi:hypothetical protein FACS1894109_05730 [Spirochaetia bacterium]|nr:hypothetical protein FACS1894109_05730 [Spirochaetia bacterium]
MKTRIALLLISVLLLTGCNNFINELIPKEDWPPAVEEPGEELPQPPAILTFKTTGPETAIGVIDQAALTITINVPNGTDVTNMTTAITTLPANAALSPSWTGPTNFSGPVRYTVSDGGISKTYMVTVIVGTAPPPVIYTVTFDKNNTDSGSTEADPQRMPAVQGGTINPLPAAPTRPGYTFTGWNRAANGSGTVFGNSTPVMADITVYAQWTANAYTVTFDKNGGDTDASPAAKTVTVPATTIDALPTTDPTWASHTFEDWWTKNGDGGDWGTEFTASTPVTQNITVYARWNPPPNYYTVTFDKNGGDTEADPNTAGVAAGNTVNPLPTQPARTGYTFVGWNRAANGGGTVFDATTTVAAAITVYAQWTANTHTVVYNANGGTGTTANSTHTYNVAQALTVNGFTRTGYTFAGWAESASGAVRYSNNESVINLSAVNGATVNLYAKWTANTYTVTFNKNNTDSGSTEANPQTAVVADGGTVNPLPTQPTRTGYTFVGWNTAADGSETAFTATTTVTASITVYAQWIDTPLILVINGSSGTFTIPTNNTWAYDWTIDWGDGIVETKTGTGASNTGISHTYAANPQYTIGITANSSTGHAAFGYSDTTSGANAAANKQKLLKALGHIKENTSVAVFPNAWRYCFYNCTNLNEVSPDLLPAIPNGTSNIFEQMFYQCTSLSSLPAGFQLPAIPNGTSYIFRRMFWMCTSLSSLPAGFQLPAVPNGTSGIFEGMFMDCRSLSALPAAFQLPAVPNGTSSIFANMFWRCQLLNSLPAGFQLPAVPNGTSQIFSQMFSTTRLNSLPTGFQLPAVPNGTIDIFANMFTGCNFSSLPAGFQLPAVPNGTSGIFSSMFSSCYNLSSLPAAFQLPAVPNGTNNIFYAMFSSCYSLSSLPAAFQLPAVPNGTSEIFAHMFSYCESLSSLPAAFQLPAVPNGTSSIFSYMFLGCSSLSALPAAFQLPAVPNGTSHIFFQMFSDCSALNTNIENLIGPNIFSPGQQLNFAFMGNAFEDCSSLTGSASNALSMGFYGNTTTPPPTPSTDLNTFRGCPASVTAGLHANWK